jgi:hypothetical protein
MDGSSPSSAQPQPQPQPQPRVVVLLRAWSWLKHLARQAREVKCSPATTDRTERQPTTTTRLVLLNPPPKIPAAERLVIKGRASMPYSA